MDVHFRQEAELKSFLSLLGVSSPVQGREIGNNFFITELSQVAGKFLSALNNEAVLLSYKINEKIYPISLFFIECFSSKFGHGSLLLMEYEKAGILETLQEATKKFFAQNDHDLLYSLNPKWAPIDLKGLTDKRVYWDQIISDDLFPTNFKGSEILIPNLTVLPSVYHFNQPYMKNIVEVALPEIKKADRILIMGVGAGLEAIFAATATDQVIDAVDINPIAVLNAKMTAQRAGISHRFRVWESDLFDAVADKYDKILFNAPLAVASRRELDPNRFDHEGALLKRLFTELPTYLKKGGKLFLMSHPNQDPWMPDHLAYKVRKTFNAVITCAIMEIGEKSSFGTSPESLRDHSNKSSKQTLNA